MEVYTENEEVVNLLSPRPYDNSLSLKTVVDCLGVRAKSYCNSSINHYLFSFGTSWLTICPRRSDYAVMGRLFPREQFKVLKSTVDYDYYFRGSYNDCKSVFSQLVQNCLNYNYELC